MIKIKDYIFNENDIRKIYYNKDESCLCVGFRDKDLVTNWVDNATFEDIEWNYEDEQIRKCLDSIDREEELEEENKKLNELVQFNVETTSKLTKRINKAIKRCEELKEAMWESEGAYTEMFDEINEILKGE